MGEREFGVDVGHLLQILGKDEGVYALQKHAYLGDTRLFSGVSLSVEIDKIASQQSVEQLGEPDGASLRCAEREFLLS